MPYAPSLNVSLFTLTGDVLRIVTLYPEARIRDIAADANVTDRAVQAVLSNLSAAGMVEIVRLGRRNRYVIPEAWQATAELLGRAHAARPDVVPTTPAEADE